jgi:aldehyde:ferredoxin oxidoreductase
MFGWSGNLLNVSLSDDSISYEDTPYTHDYVGGRGLGVRLFFERASPHIDPLDPSCPLIFSLGPLNGTTAPTSGRCSAVSRSPLTMTIFDSNCGGSFATRAKACGIDAVSITGHAPSPSILVIEEGAASLVPAPQLWGTDIPTAGRTLKERYGSRAGIAMIGPAGEAGVRYATISTDDYRVFGRGGLGAVMGAKNLQAIVFKGSRKTGVADPSQLRFVREQARKLLEANPITSRGLKAFGTPILVNIVNTMGMFPVHNYQRSHTDRADEVSGEAITSTMLEKRRACTACTIQCDRVTSIGDVRSRGPEYETVWALGPNCGVFDLHAIATSNKLCNELGLDTITCGATIACAMELAERGHLDADLSFGMDISPIVRSISSREGLGDALAEGSRRLAESVGAPDYAMQVKGLELPAYDPRGAQGMGLAYAVSNRGACHLRSYILGSEVLGIPKLLDRMLTGEKVSLEITLEHLNAAVDSLSLCRFTTFALSEEYFSRMLTSVTGIEYTETDLMRIGERIWNLERLYNVRAGFSRSDDTLPPRLLDEPIVDGPAAGQVCRLDEMLPGYYRARGWDADGNPLPHKLEELGLAHV